MFDCGCDKRREAIASIFSPKLRKPTREAVIAEAKGWLKTPFHHQGYVKGAGTDCIGLIAGVALALNMPEAQAWKDDPAMHQYGRPPNPRFLLESCERFLTKGDIANPRLADILLMSFEREPMHFALISFLNPLYVIHALNGRGEVVEHRVDEGWRNKVRGIYSYRGLAD